MKLKLYHLVDHQIYVCTGMKNYYRFKLGGFHVNLTQMFITVYLFLKY